MLASNFNKAALPLVPPRVRLVAPPVELARVRVLIAPSSRLSVPWPSGVPPVFPPLIVRLPALLVPRVMLPPILSSAWPALAVGVIPLPTVTSVPPRLPALLRIMVPWLIAVVPVNVLDPVKVRAPLPVLVKEPLPLIAPA